MSIFTEMYDLRVFESFYAYKEFLRKLSRALDEGWVEEIPVAIQRKVPRDERWFRDKETGEVYILEGLEGKPSSWRPAEPEELFPSSPIGIDSRMKN